MIDFGESLGVAVAAVLLGWFGAAAFRGERTGLRRAAAVLAALLLLSPTLLIGYAYADFTPVIRLSMAGRQAVYSVLLCARLLAITSAIWLVCHNGVSASAWHSLNILRGRITRGKWLREASRLMLRGGGRAAAIAFGVAFLVTYMEFELASFLAVERWAVRMFDAQVAGTSLGSSWRVATGPALLATVLFLVCAWLAGAVGRDAPLRGHHDVSRKPGATGAAAVGLLLFVLATLLIVGIPVYTLVRHAVTGSGVLGRAFGLRRELLSSLLLGSLVGVATWWLARRLVHASHRGWALAALLPGMHGALLLGLSVLTLLQLPLLWRLRQTPLPLICAEVFSLLPLGVLLAILVRDSSNGASLHSAKLLARSRSSHLRRTAGAIDWRYRLRPIFWCVGLLGLHAFSEITLSTLLAPVRMPLVMPRLYNFMHYGRSDNLTLWLLFCVLAPMALFVALSFVTRAWRVRHVADLDVG